MVTGKQAIAVKAKRPNRIRIELVVIFIYENAAFVKGWNRFSIRKDLLDETSSGFLPTQSGPAGYIYSRSSRKSMFRKRVAIIRRISRIQKINALTLALARPSGE
jgi:hypothetical protein